MALQFAALLPKAIGLAKGLTGLGGAVKSGAAGAGAFAKGAAAKRMAGQGLAKAADTVIGKELMSKPGELAFRLAPDVAFGTMSAIATPGDLGDKLIAGTTQAMGGGLGGIAAGRGARALGMGERGAGMVDLGASFVGDMAGMQVGDALMRAKGGGMTPYERQAAEADAQYKAALEEEFRQKYGIGGADPFLAENGLG